MSDWALGTVALVAPCDGPFRVRNHLVGRDASYEEALCERNRSVRRDASYEEALCERNRFVCPSVFEKVRTAFIANLWGIRNGYVSLWALSL